MNQELLTKKIGTQSIGPIVKQRKMGRSYCPICGPRNSFVIDECGYLQIFLCLSCARREGYFVDTSKVIKCQTCGEIFIPIKSLTCPCCWVLKFAEEAKWKK